MSGPASSQLGRLPSPGPSVNLSSNNPFRNRAASPASQDLALASPASTSPFDDPTSRQRPLSRNPFLDNSDQAARSPGTVPNKSSHQSLSAQNIFDSLTLDDKMPSHKLPPSSSAQRRPSEQLPIRPSESSQTVHQRSPTKSPPEAMKAKKLAPGSRPDTSRSPQRKSPRGTRRNSDSSVMDFNAQPITPEELKMIEAKRMRDRQRDKVTRESRDGREPRDEREPRDGREGREKERESKARSKSGRPSKRVDIIDQLDATGIYGTGLFHHDGPFDALNPHRNRQSSRRAPMQAFPKDSLNNSLGGAGPLNRNPDHKTFMGNGTDEAFHDYSGINKNKTTYNYSNTSTEPTIFDPISRGAMVHGDETYGLGTSTFLEGTPAAQTAIARRRAEQQQEISEGGLQRKKSLAQRIRHINKGPRDFAPSGRLTSPESAAAKPSPDPIALATSDGTESNPFFAEFSKGEESISVRPRDRGMSGSGLERRATMDGSATPLEDMPPAKPSGLLGRMKSLKGGRRPKNPDTGAQPAAPKVAI